MDHHGRQWTTLDEWWRRRESNRLTLRSASDCRRATSGVNPCNDLSYAILPELTAGPWNPPKSSSVVEEWGRRREQCPAPWFTTVPSAISVPDPTSRRTPTPKGISDGRDAVLEEAIRIWIAS